MFVAYLTSTVNDSRCGAEALPAASVATKVARQADLPGIAPNILTQRLRQLERHALVVARPYCRRPPRFVYELTGGGRELAGALRMLAEWGARNSEQAEHPQHAVCGTPVEARWYCPTCEQTVDTKETEEEQYV